MRPGTRTGTRVGRETFAAAPRRGALPQTLLQAHCPSHARSCSLAHTNVVICSQMSSQTHTLKHTSTRPRSQAQAHPQHCPTEDVSTVTLPAHLSRAGHTFSQEHTLLLPRAHTPIEARRSSKELSGRNDPGQADRGSAPPPTPHFGSWLPSLGPRGFRLSPANICDASVSCASTSPPPFQGPRWTLGEPEKPWTPSS